MFAKRLSLRPIADATGDCQTKSFTIFTSSLIDLIDWCKTEGVTQIEMESTGIYWKSLFNNFAIDFKVILVNVRHSNNVPKHKKDKKDCI
jgi:transposase